MSGLLMSACCCESQGCVYRDDFNALQLGWKESDQSFDIYSTGVSFLRDADQDVMTGSGTGSLTMIAGPASASLIFVRAKLRSSPSGNFSGVTIRRADSSANLVLVRKWGEADTYELRHDQTVLKTFTASSSAQPIIELRLTGIGTANVTAECYVDGVLSHSESGVAFTSPDVLNLGLFVEGEGLWDWVEFSPCAICEETADICGGDERPLYWTLSVTGITGGFTTPWPPDENTYGEDEGPCPGDYIPWCEVFNGEYVVLANRYTMSVGGEFIWAPNNIKDTIGVPRDPYDPYDTHLVEECWYESVFLTPGVLGIFPNGGFQWGDSRLIGAEKTDPGTLPSMAGVVTAVIAGTVTNPDPPDPDVPGSGCDDIKKVKGYSGAMPFEDCRHAPMVRVFIYQDVDYLTEQLSYYIKCVLSSHTFQAFSILQPPLSKRIAFNCFVPTITYESSPLPKATTNLLTDDIELAFTGWGGLPVSRRGQDDCSNVPNSITLKPGGGPLEGVVQEALNPCGACEPPLPVNRFALAEVTFDGIPPVYCGGAVPEFNQNTFSWEWHWKSLHAHEGSAEQHLDFPAECDYYIPGSVDVISAHLTCYERVEGEGQRWWLELDTHEGETVIVPWEEDDNPYQDPPLGGDASGTAVKCGSERAWAMHALAFVFPIDPQDNPLAHLCPNDPGILCATGLVAWGEWVDAYSPTPNLPCPIPKTCSSLEWDSVRQAWIGDAVITCSGGGSWFLQIYPDGDAEIIAWDDEIIMSRRAPQVFTCDSLYLEYQWFNTGVDTQQKIKVTLASTDVPCD